MIEDQGVLSIIERNKTPLLITANTKDIFLAISNKWGSEKTVWHQGGRNV